MSTEYHDKIYQIRDNTGEQEITPGELIAILESYNFYESKYEIHLLIEYFMDNGINSAKTMKYNQWYNWLIKAGQLPESFINKLFYNCL